MLIQEPEEPDQAAVHHHHLDLVASRDQVRAEQGHLTEFTEDGREEPDQVQILQETFQES